MLDVRSELARVFPQEADCQRAELAGLLKAAGMVELKGTGEMSVVFETYWAAVARKAVSLFRELYHNRPTILASPQTGLRRGHEYIIRFASPQELSLLQDLGFWEEELVFGIPHRLVESQSCAIAYCRGVFLGRGSLSDPERSYHLEFICQENIFAQDLCKLLGKLGIRSKVRQRKDSYLVYLKDASQISKFLILTGAHGAALVMENARLVRGVRNEANRLVNCETANLSKTVEAGLRQAQALSRLLERGVKLPPHLLTLAKLRIASPEASLRELGKQLDPPLSKSGVNHRLRKLMAMAEELGLD